MNHVTFTITGPDADKLAQQIQDLLGAIPVQLPALFSEALAWGKIMGPKIPAHQWPEMRDSMAQAYAKRAAPPAQTSPSQLRRIGYFAFRDEKSGWGEDSVCKDPVYPAGDADDQVSVAIYTAPQPPVSAPLLEDMSILSMWHETSSRVPLCNHYNHFARAIEQAVRQKAGLK